MYVKHDVNNYFGSSSVRHVELVLRLVVLQSPSSTYSGFALYITSYFGELLFLAKIIKNGINKKIKNVLNKQLWVGHVLFSYCQSCTGSINTFF